MIEVRPMDDPTRESCPNSLEVNTFPKPTQPDVILANITWIRQTSDRSMSFQPLVQSEAMSHDTAMEWARAFAAKNGVPTIFERRAK
jgi:hypothetical protein